MYKLKDIDKKIEDLSEVLHAENNLFDLRSKLRDLTHNNKTKTSIRKRNRISSYKEALNNHKAMVEKIKSNKEINQLEEIKENESPGYFNQLSKKINTLFVQPEIDLRSYREDDSSNIASPDCKTNIKSNLFNFDIKENNSYEEKSDKLEINLPNINEEINEEESINSEDRI